MAHMQTIPVDKMWRSLRRHQGRLTNFQGWAVFETADGLRSYVIDEQGNTPLSFRSVLPVLFGSDGIPGYTQDGRWS